MDAASQTARHNLLKQREAFRFDASLLPFLRVSIPLDKLEDGTYSVIRVVNSLPPRDDGVPYPPRLEHLPPAECVIGRGYAEFWQEPDLAPEITWYPSYSGVKLYTTACDYYCIATSGTRYITSRPLGFRETGYRAFHTWRAKRQGEDVKERRMV